MKKPSNHRIVILITAIVVVAAGGWPALSHALEPGSPALAGLDIGKVTSKLNVEILNAPAEEMITCIVTMKEDYPFELLRGRSVFDKIATYRAIAEETQEPVVEILNAHRSDAVVVDRYWIINGFHLKAKPRVIAALSNRVDVERIFHNETFFVDAEPADPLDEILGDRDPEWGVWKIMAHLCWSEGYTGEGIIVGHTDTGVDVEHPALAGKWAGYWFDAINGQETPYDDNGHGTHTMGTIVGGDGLGPFADDIGVAPGATFVTAKVLNGFGSGSSVQIMSGLQWIADLKETVDVKVMSASWRNFIATDTSFWPAMLLYHSLGILPVVGNGNEGPKPASSGTPGNYPMVLGVGATDPDDNVASFSSRGPAPEIDPWTDTTYWLRPDWNFIKPDVCAPGVYVRSSMPGGTYQVQQGTSMATPHVAGAVAILCQKNPTLTPAMLYNLLVDTADQPEAGGPYPNNEYGWGRINVWEALLAAPSTDQPFLTVTEREFTDPAPGGDGDGILEAGETAQLVVTVKNLGTAAYDASVQIFSEDIYFTVDDTYFFVGDLGPDETKTNAGDPFLVTFHALTPPGHSGRVRLDLDADGDTEGYTHSVAYSTRIGTEPPPIVVYSEDFEYGMGESFSDYWEVTDDWGPVTDDWHSAGTSVYNGGTATRRYAYLTMKGSLDLSHFPEAEAVVWHKYDWDQGFFTNARIEALNESGKWKKIWNFGSGFAPGTIHEWKPIEASLGSYALPGTRIRFGVSADPFFSRFAHWYVDDLTITSPDDEAPPYFNGTTELADTDAPGPYTVQSRITDKNGVVTPLLFFSVDGGTATNVPMTDLGSDLFEARIPGQPLGSVVHYFLWATDGWIDPNSGTVPVGAPADGTFSFTVRELLPEETDDDGDGFSEVDGDCDDTDPAVSPDADELCDDGVDNDCDGLVDDDDTHCISAYTLSVSGTFAAGTMSLVFTVGAPNPVTWSTFAVITTPETQVIPLWEVPVPAIQPAVDVPVSFPFPSVGAVGIYALLTEAGATVASDELWLDTGAAGL